MGQCPKPEGGLFRGGKAWVAFGKGEGGGYVCALFQHEEEDPLLSGGEALEAVQPDLFPCKPAVGPDLLLCPAQIVFFIGIMGAQQGLICTAEKGKV